MIRAIFEKLIVIPIATIAICNVLMLLCLVPRFGLVVGPFGGLVDWLMLGVATFLALIMAATTALDHLLNRRVVAKRAAPWMYRLAMRCPMRSHRRLWLENRIMQAGRDVLGIKRVRSARRVIEALAKAAAGHVETVTRTRRTETEAAPDYTAPWQVIEDGEARQVERPEPVEASPKPQRSRRFNRPRSAFRKVG